MRRPLPPVAFVVVTAYDEAGNESEKSEELVVFQE
jgi:hypothetical protein